MAKRTKFIAGNWKMNPGTLEEAVALATAVKNGLGDTGNVHVALCPPSVFLHRLDDVVAKAPPSALAVRTCTGRPRVPTPVSCLDRCCSTSAAPTSSLDTVNAGTEWVRPTSR